LYLEKLNKSLHSATSQKARVLNVNDVEISKLATSFLIYFSDIESEERSENQGRTFRRKISAFTLTNQH
jgi:hypothetical protein